VGAGPRAGLLFLVYINTENLPTMLTGNLHLDVVDIGPHLFGLLIFSVPARVYLAAFSTIAVLALELNKLSKVLSIVAPLHPRRGKFCGGWRSTSLSHLVLKSTCR